MKPVILSKDEAVTPPLSRKERIRNKLAEMTRQFQGEQATAQGRLATESHQTRSERQEEVEHDANDQNLVLLLALPPLPTGAVHAIHEFLEALSASFESHHWSVLRPPHHQPPHGDHMGEHTALRNEAKACDRLEDDLDF